MNENTLYVRSQLEEARKERGRIAIISRETNTDRRTVLEILGNRRVAHAATVDKLAAYFRRLAKKANQVKTEEVKE